MKYFCFVQSSDLQVLRNQDVGERPSVMCCHQQRGMEVNNHLGIARMGIEVNSLSDTINNIFHALAATYDLCLYTMK